MATAFTMDAATNPDSELDRWRLDLCPECGYSLTGLPDHRKCPECGEAFDRTRIILVGWGRGSHIQLAGGTWVTWVVAGFCLIMAVSVAVGFARDRFEGISFMNLVFYSTTFVFALLARFSSRKPGLTQVHMDTVGCWQLDDVSHFDGNAWTRAAKKIGTYSAIIFIAWFAWKLISGIRSGEFFDPTIIGVLFALLGVVAVFAWRRNRGRDTTSDARWRGALTYPWSVIAGYTVNPTRDGWHRVTMTPNVIYTMSKIAPVDAEVRCTTHRAEQLRAILGLYLSARNATPATRATLLAAKFGVDTSQQSSKPPTA